MISVNSIPIYIQFIIFDNKILNDSQKEIKLKLMYDDLKQIIYTEKYRLLQNFKIIDRFEPSITSINEKKTAAFISDIQLYPSSLSR